MNLTSHLSLSWSSLFLSTLHCVSFNIRVNHNHKRQSLASHDLFLCITKLHLAQLNHYFDHHFDCDCDCLSLCLYNVCVYAFIMFVFMLMPLFWESLICWIFQDKIIYEQIQILVCWNLQFLFSRTIFCCGFYGKWVFVHGPFFPHIQSLSSTMFNKKQQPTFWSSKVELCDGHI